MFIRPKQPTSFPESADVEDPIDCPRRRNPTSSAFRPVLIPLSVLICLFVLGVQLSQSAVIWFLSVIVPFQPWQSLLLDGVAVITAMGGSLLLVQPVLRQVAFGNRWVVGGERVLRLLLPLLLIVEVGTIIGELTTAQVPGYIWNDLFPAFPMFLALFLMQVSLGHAAGFLLRLRASSIEPPVDSLERDSVPVLHMLSTTKCKERNV